MKKDCVNCNKEFIKPRTCSLVDWSVRKFCSKECHDAFRRGKPSPSPTTTFKKGQVVFVPSSSRRRGIDNNKWGGGPTILNCEICKKDFRVHKHRSLKAKTCSRICEGVRRKTPEFRLFQSELQLKLANKKFGEFRSHLTALDKIIRHSFRYKRWREEVFKRDDFTCRGCGLRGGVLRADHIKQFAIILIQNDIKSFEEALKCAELWDESNGQTLCNQCHISTPTYGMRVINRNLWTNQL